jgi:hypothetical protein
MNASEKPTGCETTVGTLVVSWFPRKNVTPVGSNSGRECSLGSRSRPTWTEGRLSSRRLIGFPDSGDIPYAATALCGNRGRVHCFPSAPHSIL